MHSLKGCGTVVSAALSTVSIAQHSDPFPSKMLQIDLCADVLADVLAYADADDQLLTGGQQSSSIAPAAIAQGSRAQG